jgi:NADPH-dependent 2,4-dienoyl-CoA reductase/sulfur reductase-like enzyme
MTAVGWTETSTHRDAEFVVGASLAPIRAVEAVRREGYHGEVVLLSREEHLPYDRPPLTKEFLVNDETLVQFLGTQDRLAELDVELRLNYSATGLDPGSRTIHAGQATIGYDKLLIATGTDARQLPLAQRHGLFTLRTADDAVGVRSALREAHRVVIIGAGVIGCEVASSARALGLDVTMVEAAPVPSVRVFGEPIGRALADLHARYGPRLLTGVQVTDIIGEPAVHGVILDTGEHLDTDLVVVGVGSAPATSWLTSSGITLHGLDGGIICDAYLRTSVENVYAAGDIVHWPNGAAGSVARLENWSNAADQGSRAGLNAIFPNKTTAYVTVPYFGAIGTGKVFSLSAPHRQRRSHSSMGRRTRNDSWPSTTPGTEYWAPPQCREQTMKLRRLIGAHGTVQDASTLIVSKQSRAKPQPAVGAHLEQLEKNSC